MEKSAHHGREESRAIMTMSEMSEKAKKIVVRYKSIFVGPAHGNIEVTNI